MCVKAALGCAYASLSVLVLEDVDRDHGGALYTHKHHGLTSTTSVSTWTTIVRSRL